jgi:hypothetical protein
MRSKSATTGNYQWPPEPISKLSQRRNRYPSPLASYLLQAPLVVWAVHPAYCSFTLRLWIPNWLGATLKYDKTCLRQRATGPRSESHMASTYALPVTSTTQAHSHGHSRSLYLADPSPVWGQSNGHSHNDQGAMPYANTHDHSHQHSHERSKSLQRPKGRARGESDLGRPAERKSGSTGKFGFSPIQEVAAHPPPSSYVWMELEK